MTRKALYHTRLRFVLEALQKCNSSPARKLLDIGFVGEYAEADVHYTIENHLNPDDGLVGVDVAPHKIARFLSNDKTRKIVENRRAVYLAGSIFQLPFPESYFDAAFILEVMEHLPTPYLIFEELHRVLKPGGSFILTYPNPISLPRLIHYALAPNLLDPAYLAKYRGADDHKVFPHPSSLIVYLQYLKFDVRAVEFMKYGEMRFSFLNKWLARAGLTTKFANYVGVHASKP